MSLSRLSLIAVLAVISAVSLAAGPARRSSRPQEPARPSAAPTLIMLGTGSPVPDPSASGPAGAVVVDGRLFLVDAGAGVTRQLAAAGFPRVKDLAAVFVTHLHSDHTLGYPDVIFTTWLMGRRQPLAVFGPPGLRRMTDGILDAWRDDVELRVKGLERETREWLRVEATEVQAGVVFDQGGVKVTAVPVRHGEWPSFAYRFDAPGRSITFSGDTAPNPALIEAARGTDILVHEVYNGKRVAPESRPGGEFWPEYLRTYHTSDAELARIASQVNPGLLVLNHVLRLGGTNEEILQNIRAAGYKGRVVVAKDLDRY